MTSDSPTNPYILPQTSVASGPSSQPYTPYYSYPWQNNNWYPGNYQPYYPASQFTLQPRPPLTQRAPAPIPAAPPKPPSPPPSPPPPPSTYKHWDEVLVSFLRDVGLTQAAAGFEADMLVLNAEWEQKKVPGALKDLVKNISLLGKDQDDAMNEDPPTAGVPPPLPKAPERQVNTPLDERKLSYVHLSPSAPAEPKTQTSINKEISLFLARKRARNDASNRAEFVYSLAEKQRQRRQLLQEQNGASADGEGKGKGKQIETETEYEPSCARVDSKPVDRDVQMKYDIARNEEGPLRRTVVAVQVVDVKGKAKAKAMEDAAGAGVNARPVTAENHPGLDERLNNIEAHLAVRYVPSPPTRLLDRLKCLEEHIIRLEKDYPPWAALHFSQPNRGWPPPPRLTPIIVPPQMRIPPSAKPSFDEGGARTSGQNGSGSGTPAGGSGAKMKTKMTSSLHRAVLEKLEVQQAMQDLGRP